VARDVCNGSNSYQGYIQDGQICAGFDEGQINHCFGDSGGPLYASINNKQQLIGVVTLGGDICEAPFIYGVYSDVSFYRNWISSYVSLDTLPADDDPANTAVAPPEVGAPPETVAPVAATPVIILSADSTSDIDRTQSRGRHNSDSAVCFFPALVSFCASTSSTARALTSCSSPNSVYWA
jgi:secreted trypsin-like serine protease